MSALPPGFVGFEPDATFVSLLIQCVVAGSVLGFALNIVARLLHGLFYLIESTLGLFHI